MTDSNEDRIRELARLSASLLHYEGFEPHGGPFLTCSHPDCVLVREPVDPPPQGAERPAPRQPEPDVLPVQKIEPRTCSDPARHPYECNCD